MTKIKTPIVSRDDLLKALALLTDGNYNHVNEIILETGLDGTDAEFVYSVSISAKNEFFKK